MKASAEGGDQAGDERADRGGGERRAAAARAGHLVALERRDDRGALARRVEQDRGGRAAVHAAVVDAGEHDQRAGRVELVGDRQQQRDGQRRPDAGQHADGGAERDADQRVEQVDRLQRAGEAVARGARRCPWRVPRQRNQPLERPGGQRELQEPGEDQPDRRARRRCRSGRSSRAARAEAARRAGEEQAGGDREAGGLQQQHLQRRARRRSRASAPAWSASRSGKSPRQADDAVPTASSSEAGGDHVGERRRPDAGVLRR